MIEHATVLRDGYKVPLIGIPKDAVEEKCEACGKVVYQLDAVWDGNRMVCNTCFLQTTTTTGAVNPP